MKRILALLIWGLICIPKEPEAFTFAKMEVGHPVMYFENVFLMLLLYSNAEKSYCTFTQIKEFYISNPH